jgi:hypothetical protein
MPAMRAVPSTSPFLALPETIGDRHTLCGGFGGDVDHPRFAGAVDMAEGEVFFRSALRFLAGHELPRSGGAGSVIAGQQCARCRRDVGLPHQAFTDQKGRHANLRQPREVGRREDAGY